jgi:hypothetical protein
LFDQDTSLVAVGHVDGRDTIVRGRDDATVRMWDAAIGALGVLVMGLLHAGIGAFGRTTEPPQPIS